jgi:hypothetical protein
VIIFMLGVAAGLMVAWLILRWFEWFEARDIKRSRFYASYQRGLDQPIALVPTSWPSPTEEQS